MLRDFWRLNNTFTNIDTQEYFFELINTSKYMCNIQYLPDKFCSDGKYPYIKIKNIKFENISFSKTTFENVLFENCTFCDCLFIGSKFNNCRIVDCTFKYVNMSYCTFYRTYIEPNCVKNIFINNKSYSNLAISFYQGLFNSLKEYNQPELAADAEFYFMYWNKIHKFNKLKKAISNKKIKIIFGSELRNYGYYMLLSFFGYGIRILQYLLSVFIVYFLFFIFNYIFWESINPSNYFNGDVDKLHHILFFTFYTFSSIGSTPMAPISAFGIGLAIFEGVIGWILLGVGLTIIVKKFVR